MVKAHDLINNQKNRENIKYKTFEKIFSNIEKKIIKASSTNFYYVWYEIPQYIIGAQLYNYKECIEFINNKLINNDFKTEVYEPSILLISWFPNS